MYGGVITTWGVGIAKERFLGYEKPVRSVHAAVCKAAQGTL